MKIIIILLFVVVLSSCDTNNSCEIIDESNDNLTKSMFNFFNDDSTSYGESDNFMAKIISLDKVAYYDDAIGESYIYKMIIAVAPRCDKQMHIDYFGFELSTEARNYYDNFPWLISYAYFDVLYYKDYDLPIVNGQEDAEAYRFDIIFDNAGKENQLAYGFSNYEFDEMVKELNITVHFDGVKEDIKIIYRDDIYCYENVSDIPDSRADLKDIASGRNIQQVAGYYTELVQ